jgi:Stress responsive A/B Barrel Domain
MIRHIVLFRWSETASPEQKSRAAAEIGRLPSLVPSIREFSSGTDLGVNEGNLDFAVTAVFDDMDGYLAYRDNPDHRAMVRDHILPIAAVRAAIQLLV